MRLAIDFSCTFLHSLCWPTVFWAPELTRSPWAVWGVLLDGAQANKKQTPGKKKQTSGNKKQTPGKKIQPGSAQAKKNRPQEKKNRVSKNSARI